MSEDIPSNTDVVAGIAKGTLEWGDEKVRDIVKRYRNKELAFVEDPDTVSLVKKQRKSSEWKILGDILKDKELRILASMGLTLRDLEKDPVHAQELRNSIHRKFGADGLHIAEAVQNGIVSIFIGIETPTTSVPADLTRKVEKLLNNIEKYIVFIGPEDKMDFRHRQIQARLLADVPDTLVLFGAYKAKRLVKDLASKIQDEFDDYEISSTENEVKIVVVINRLV